MPKQPTSPCRPADRRAVLEMIARVLRGGVLSDPEEDLGAWVAGVEIVEVLGHAGFRIVRHRAVPLDAVPSGTNPEPGQGAGEQRH